MFIKFWVMHVGLQIRNIRMYFETDPVILIQIQIQDQFSTFPSMIETERVVDEFYDVLRQAFGQLMALTEV